MPIINPSLFCYFCQCDKDVMKMFKRRQRIKRLWRVCISQLIEKEVLFWGKRGEEEKILLSGRNIQISMLLIKKSIEFCAKPSSATYQIKYYVRPGGKNTPIFYRRIVFITEEVETKWEQQTSRTRKGLQLSL